MIDAGQPAWHPIASSGDLPLRHVFHGQLLGQEMAVWRADDGNVNVWENRCLHRGVRLSIGINDGAELKCQYHGWRYANRTAGCTYIPAHPADAPARRIANRTYPAIERHGLIWTALAELPDFGAAVPEGEWRTLRPIPVNATPETVLAALRDAREDGTAMEDVRPLAVSIVLAGSGDGPATFFVQPVDAGRAVIRGLTHAPRETDEEALLRRFNAILTALRDRVEIEAARKPPPEPIAPVYRPVSVELATMPDIASGRHATIRVKVARKWRAADGIFGFELAALSGLLPTFQPGAHVDVHLPNGLVRQYSITNGPGEQMRYAIAVKREPQSAGGSAALADTVREGDVIAISEPRNNFPLRRDADRTTLIAGGIGITPLIAMAKALHRANLAFDLHVFARSAEHIPFAADLDRFGGAVTRHVGLSPEATSATIREIVAGHAFARHLYVCGPGPMLDATRAAAATADWPDEAVHFEYFKNDRAIDMHSHFTVELARSALTLEVPAGKSILAVLRENGIDAPSSCEQGACGTCLTAVLYGVPDHQDVYLNASERRAGKSMLTCVSRALSPGLVLDI